MTLLNTNMISMQKFRWQGWFANCSYKIHRLDEQRWNYIKRAMRNSLQTELINFRLLFTVLFSAQAWLSALVLIIGVILALYKWTSVPSQILSYSQNYPQLLHDWGFGGTPLEPVNFVQVRFWLAQLRYLTPKRFFFHSQCTRCSTHLH